MAIPSLAWKRFHVVKGGHTPEEYEDACAGILREGRFAIADGASESSYASAWAQILVRSYVRRSGPWSEWLPAARKRWLSRLKADDLPWYAQAKFEEGAYAALLGVYVDSTHWHAEAVGDSCVFHLRDNHLRRAFPLRRAEDFGNQPNLLGSRSRNGSGPRTRRLRLRSAWRPGDVLLLMTDALAHWCLHQLEAGEEPWPELLAIRTMANFVEYVEKMRTQGMRNDDATLIRVSMRDHA